MFGGLRRRTCSREPCRKQRATRLCRNHAVQGREEKLLGRMNLGLTGLKAVGGLGLLLGPGPCELGLALLGQILWLVVGVG